MPLTLKDQSGKTIKIGQQVELTGIVSNFLLNEDKDRNVQFEVSYVDENGDPRVYLVTARPETLLIV